MKGATLRVATEEQVAKVWPAVRAAHLFDSRERFERFYAEAPWRVQVTGGGEAVLLERWRAHLDVLAMRGLWCSESRVAELVLGACRVAAGQGFGRLLSPLVSEGATAEYLRAGMEAHSAVVAFRHELGAGSAVSTRASAGVALRRGIPDDIERVLALDAVCFDEFWRYDFERLARHFAEDRIVVAEEASQVIGYTLSTSLQESGTVGRLAVAPGLRGRGVGTALLGEAVSYLERAGARSVSLCTQEENRASRELYRKAGFMEMSDRLVFLVVRTGDDRVE